MDCLYAQSTGNKQYKQEFLMQEDNMTHPGGTKQKLAKQNHQESKCSTYLFNIRLGKCNLRWTENKSPKKTYLFLT